MNKLLTETEIKVNLLIANKEVETEKYEEVRDPGKLTDIVGRIAVGSADDVDKAVQAAHQAFLLWRNTPVQERIQKVSEAAQVLQASAEELKALLVREHGGMLWEAETDFYLGGGATLFYASIAESFLKPNQREDETGTISIEKAPKGVISAIIPWNMPIVLTMNKLAPALVTGNTIVVKPSPTAPLALSLLLKRMAEVLPDGVINVVHGDADVGQAMTRHPLIRMVAFTGGTETGKKVMADAAQTIKPVTLELGGNDPAIVLDDINPRDIMPKLLKGVFTRSGQICFAVKRIYVPRSMHENFYQVLCEFVDEYKVGHGLDSRASFGPLNNKKQYDFVNQLIERTKASGATVRELGEKLDPENWNNGYYILPHVIKDAPPTADCVTCEQFGPVIPIVAYDSIEEVVKMANDGEHGLCSSIWSNDHEKALEIAKQIEAGSTFINSHSFDSLSLGMPFGGVKQSGIGREIGGEETLSEYINYHSIRLVKN
ncbi:aldehyde dehydrogenase [Bacillus sp. M6-12]|uniref:aldehyde dehydrogenase family protein n=1 Tax=Bacillus sp. M6-12 TaxID=2054166 RepID=UPI000C788FBF|nr:aldehyde dehydrogenase family protein [Bacillus sp. M6-12]PLS18600.1 aldehyde dehydrogenase [Bacillus sp. M6-12]